MNPAFDFDRHDPPHLSERALRAQLGQRRVRRQAALLACAGLLAQVALVLGGLMALERFPLLAGACFGYVLLATVGGSVVAAVFSSRKKAFA